MACAWSLLGRRVCFCDISPVLANVCEQGLPLAHSFTLLYISKGLTIAGQASHPVCDTWADVSGPHLTASLRFLFWLGRLFTQS